MKIQFEAPQLRKESFQGVLGACLRGSVAILDLVACELNFAANELNDVGIERVLAPLRPQESGRINELVPIYIERRAPRLGINSSTANDRSGRNRRGAKSENRQQKSENRAVARVYCQDSHLWQTSTEWRRR